MRSLGARQEMTFAEWQRSAILVSVTMDQRLEEKYASLLCHLDEQQRRLLVVADARAAGRGGISAMARAAGMSRPTIHRGLRELAEAPLPATRVRRAGGRKKLRDLQPALVRALESQIEPTTRSASHHCAGPVRARGGWPKPEETRIPGKPLDRGCALGGAGL